MSGLRRVGLLLVVALFALAAALYGQIPHWVPIHWNARGVANGFMSKPWGVLIGPLFFAGLYALLGVLPAISPRGFRMDDFRRVFEIIELAIMASLFVVFSGALLVASGRELPLVELALASLGIMLMVIGNYLGKVKRNFFLGVRTPWTLANDEVWFRTHRLAGKLFVVAGAFVIVAGLSGMGMSFVLTVILLAAFVPVVYSFVIYRKLPPGPDERAQSP